MNEQELPTAPVPLDPDWTIPPGEMLREYFQDDRARLAALATGSELSLDWLERFVRGEEVLTEREAEILERETGVRAGIWLRWEAVYRDGVAQGKTVILSE